MHHCPDLDEWNDSEHAHSDEDVDHSDDVPQVTAAAVHNHFLRSGESET